MEHDEKPLPIDIRLLGALAEKVSLFFFFVFWGSCVCVYVHDVSMSLFNACCPFFFLISKNILYI